VDEAILGVVLADGNTRRIKGALVPLLRGGPLSKDAVSRLVGRLREDFGTWRSRDLADEDISPASIPDRSKQTSASGLTQSGTSRSQTTRRR
jgi:hypothetical protein